MLSLPDRRRCSADLRLGRRYRRRATMKYGLLGAALMATVLAGCQTTQQIAAPSPIAASCGEARQRIVRTDVADVQYQRRTPMIAMYCGGFGCVRCGRHAIVLLQRARDRNGGAAACPRCLQTWHALCIRIFRRNRREIRRARRGGEASECAPPMALKDAPSRLSDGMQYRRCRHGFPVSAPTAWMMNWFY